MNPWSRLEEQAKGMIHLQTAAAPLIIKYLDPISETNQFLGASFLVITLFFFIYVKVKVHLYVDD